MSMDVSTIARLSGPTHRRPMHLARHTQVLLTEAGGLELPAKVLHILHQLDLGRGGTPELWPGCAVQGRCSLRSLENMGEVLRT